MNNEKGTSVDRIWTRIKNNRYLAIIIVLGAIIAGVASFSDNLTNIVKKADTLISGRQTTDIIDQKELIPGSTFEDYFNTNFEVADNEESDIVNLSKDKISIDFSINNTDGDFKYTIKRKDGQLIINPYNHYLSLLKGGGPITPLNYFFTPFDFQFPTLDFKIINNSDKTIFFTKAVLSVSRSRPDQFPVIIIQEGYNMELPVENIGWGKVYNCRIYFNLEPSNVQSDFKNGFRNELLIGDFEVNASNTDLSSYYKKLGVKTDIIRNDNISGIVESGNGSYTIIDETGKEKVISETEYLKRILEARGPFKDGYSKIFGEIHYEGINISGKIVKEKVRFEGTISLGEPGAGMPAPPSFVYDVRLESNKDNYKKEIPLSQAIKPNEFDRFNIKLSASKSSRHQFTLTLFYNENRQFSIPDISLNYFMTKSDSSYITNDKSRENENR